MTTLNTEKTPEKKQKRYSRAPITEAVIDISLKSSGDSLLSKLGELESQLKEQGYPHKKETFLLTGEVIFAEEIITTGERAHNGYSYSTEDSLQIAQFRTDGFTFSRLWPYECWETFRNEAQRLWNIYRTCVGIEEINRLAVRYINRLDLPLPFNDFSEFLLTMPQMSPEMPSQGLSRYLMQLESPQIDIRAMLVINQTLVQPETPNPEKVSVIFDLDLFCRTSFSHNDDEAIWALFEMLHKRENEAFEASITDKMREEII